MAKLCQKNLFAWEYWDQKTSAQKFREAWFSHDGLRLFNSLPKHIGDLKGIPLANLSVVLKNICDKWQMSLKVKVTQSAEEPTLGKLLIYRSYLLIILLLVLGLLSSRRVSRLNHSPHCWLFLEKGTRKNVAI